MNQEFLEQCWLHTLNLINMEGVFLRKCFWWRRDFMIDPGYRTTGCKYHCGQQCSSKRDSKKLIAECRNQKPHFTQKWYRWPYFTGFCSGQLSKYPARHHHRGCLWQLQWRRNCCRWEWWNSGNSLLFPAVHPSYWVNLRKFDWLRNIFFVRCKLH